MHAQTDTDAAREFTDIVGESQLLTGERIGPDYHHTRRWSGNRWPHALWPARGSGTGLSAAARPCPNGLLISRPSPTGYTKRIHRGREHSTTSSRI
jgi:hypothetical protein